MTYTERAAEAYFRLIDEIEMAETWYSETKGQFDSEVGMFGDGWAGGQLDLQDGLTAIHQLHKDLAVCERALGMEGMRPVWSYRPLSPLA